jgi:hypothetical protein
VRIRSRGRARSRGRGLLLLLLGASALPGSAAAQSTHVLVVTGLGGAPEYTRRFAEWGGGLVRAAVAAGVPEANVVWLAERESVDAWVAGVARRDAVAGALTSLASRSAPGDLVLVALFGHGSARGDEARLNLPGPDLSAGELATLLAPLEDRRVVVVNAASASGGFVAPLSRNGRVVITATRSSRENQATRFGGHFVAALAGEAADTDKDGRVSILEAFEFARLEVARSFAEAGHLPTEHALLDDDGALAATLSLAPAPAVAGADDDPALRALRAEEARLQAELAELRDRRDTMDADAYQAALEALLLEIARNGRAIREAGGGP